LIDCLFVVTTPEDPYFAARPGREVKCCRSVAIQYRKIVTAPLKMEKCKVKSTIISRFKSFQVFSTQKPGIHRSHPDVDDGNEGILTSTKYLNVC